MLVCKDKYGIDRIKAPKLPTTRTKHIDRDVDSRVLAPTSLWHEQILLQPAHLKALLYRLAVTLLLVSNVVLPVREVRTLEDTVNALTSSITYSP